MVSSFILTHLTPHIHAYTRTHTGGGGHGWHGRAEQGVRAGPRRRRRGGDGGQPPGLRAGLRRDTAAVSITTMQAYESCNDLLDSTSNQIPPRSQTAPPSKSSWRPRATGCSTSCPSPPSRRSPPASCARPSAAPATRRTRSPCTPTAGPSTPSWRATSRTRRRCVRLLC